jgi:nitroimidazol reductase NimA-like FMN-containing flavoprotein (pyridoxamine 5'-phosphate oxidase superfamily)
MKEIPTELKEWSDKAELLRLAYLSAGGFPRVVPVWFVVIDDNAFMATDASHPKTKAMRRDSRVGWVIDGGENLKYRGVSYTGRGEEVSDPGLRASIYNAMVKKYFTSADDPNIERIFGKVDDARTVYFRLAPETVTSWQY